MVSRLQARQIVVIEDMLYVLDMASAEGNYPRATYRKLKNAFTRYTEERETKTDLVLLTKIGNGGELE